MIDDAATQNYEACKLSQRHAQRLNAHKKLHLFYTTAGFTGNGALPLTDFGSINRVGKLLKSQTPSPPDGRDDQLFRCHDLHWVAAAGSDYIMVRLHLDQIKPGSDKIRVRVDQLQVQPELYYTGSRLDQGRTRPAPDPTSIRLDQHQIRPG